MVWNIIQDLQGARPMVIANLYVEPFEGESLAEWQDPLELQLQKHVVP